MPTKAELAEYETHSARCECELCIRMFNAFLTAYFRPPPAEPAVQSPGDELSP